MPLQWRLLSRNYERVECTCLQIYELREGLVLKVLNLSLAHLCLTCSSWSIFFTKKRLSEQGRSAIMWQRYVLMSGFCSGLSILLYLKAALLIRRCRFYVMVINIIICGKRGGTGTLSYEDDRPPLSPSSRLSLNCWFSALFLQILSLFEVCLILALPSLLTIRFDLSWMLGVASVVLTSLASGSASNAIWRTKI